MKVELTALGFSTEIQDYTVTKKIDDFGVVVEIDSSAVFDKNNGYSTLLSNTMQGKTIEPALIKIDCGVEELEIDGYIMHNQGKLNLKDCRIEKSVKFLNPIECIIDKEINIFDYTPTNTNTIQGNLSRSSFVNRILVNIGSIDNNVTLDMLIGYVGPIPDLTPLGFFIEYVSLSAITTKQEDAGGDTYMGHEIDLYVSYVGLFSAIQINDDWRPSGLGGFFYSNMPSATEWKAPELEVITFNPSNEFRQFYMNYIYKSGRLNQYTNIPISNTFSVNEIFLDIFSCTGLEIKSNFLNINPDGSNPENKEYDYALKHLQNIKIAQSFDIIREGAIEDSFGKSGTFSAKQMILEFNKMFGMVLIYDSVLDLIRWEHYSYFGYKGIDFDLQNIEYEFNDDVEINRDVINIEKWLFAQPSPTEGFYSTTVDYQNYQLNTEINEISYKSDRFMTDVFGCLNNKDYEGDGYKKIFFLFSTDGVNIIALNNSMSIRSLVEGLHYKNRALKSGLHDNKSVVFDGYSYGLSGQISFFGNFKIFNKLNPNNTVKLNINGNGTWLIEEIEIENDKITLKIKK